ncbi:hypothetical protein Ddye_025711 [Dipteronia dyeriana]|uniref:HAT C-terminal dimerisation domain-containing protein n=1 Tax=Dipteronia dyeriana TaxID=168575 RepID=A0AAD9TKX0_9ROSI|nr:hypothetical protein Ddye_025711 [Dipteronia dyeriana]
MLCCLVEGYFHMRCCARILNLVVQDGLKVIADGIEKIRESVCFWIASSRRIETFKNSTNQLYGFSAFSQREIVHELLKDLIKEYELGSNLVEQLDDNSLDHSFDIFVGDEEFLYISQAVSSINKSELERYLEEQVENNSSDFDILSWWKGNKGKYPILTKVAKDILVILMSTVASKSDFSAGGRFLSPHRRRLHPDTFEVLMCTQNWIWAPIRGGIPEEEIYATIDEEEPLASI